MVDGPIPPPPDYLFPIDQPLLHELLHSSFHGRDTKVQILGYRRLLVLGVVVDPVHVQGDENANPLAVRGQIVPT